MTKASDNDFPSVLFTEGTTPSSPAASHQRLFVRSSDHVLCTVNSSGTVVAVGSGLSDPMTTRGDIIIRNASNVTARLGRGSASTVLTSDGTDVSWQAPAGGGGALALLSTTTLGSDTASVTVSGISGSYKDLVVVAKLRGTAGAGTVDSWFRVGNSSVDTGANYATNSSFTGNSSGSSGGYAQTRLYTGPQLAASATSGLFGTVQMQIFDYAATSTPRFFTGNAMMAGGASSYFLTTFSAEWFNTSSAIDVISFFPDSGNYLTGSRVYVYGRG